MSQAKQTSPAAQKRTLIISGVVTLIFGLYLSAFLVPDVLGSLSGPQRMTLAQAAQSASDQSTYATIEDGEWQCETIQYVTGPSAVNLRYTTTRSTEVFLVNDSDSIVLFASMSGRLTCDELQATELTGYLTRMSGETRQGLTNEARLARFFNASTFLEFCGYCGTENSLIGAIFGIVITLAGVVLLGLGIRKRVDEGVVAGVATGVDNSETL